MSISLPRSSIGKIKLKSFAKINLALDIIGFDEDAGYHEIETVYHEVQDIFDEIEISVTREDSLGGRGTEISMTCSDPRVPGDESNSAWKAARELQRATGVVRGAHIALTKKIPAQSGLGGAASNAAAVLKGLNELWELHLDEKSLSEIGAKIGMDVAFFICGGTALGTHFGEIISSVPPLPPNIKITLIDTGVQIDTAWAYEQVNLNECGAQANRDKTERLIAALERGDSHGVIENIHNDFEPVIFARYPALQERKEQALKDGFDTVILAGSGGFLAVLGLCPDKELVRG